MKKIYAQVHTKSESEAFFNQLICQAFYKARLYPGDALVAEKILKDILDA